MYHHHRQQEEPPQPFSNRPGPFNHQEQAHQQQQQHHSHFQYPSIKDSRDMDTEPMNMDTDMDLDCMNGSGSGGFSSTTQPLPESQPSHQQGLDWSNYQHPGQTFSSPPSTVTHQPQSSHSAMGMQAWMHEPPSPQTRGSHSGGVDGQGVPESAGSILARFGLSSQDLEVLSQYPEDQLTPDNLPYILRDMLSRKSNDQNVAASSSSSYSQSATHTVRETLPPPSSSQRSSGRRRSPEVSSLRSVAQTAVKCIDYGHSSPAAGVSSSREAFIREPLSHESKMQSPRPPASSLPKHEMDVMPERYRRQFCPQPAVQNNHGDLDYRRSSGEVHKSKRSPTAECPLPPRSRHPDPDYRRDGPKRSPSSETQSDYLSSSRRPAPWSSVSKPRDGTKRLPTPSMICDYSAESPKVYPHTCTLCLKGCEQAKDWIDHVESVKHIESCRNLHDKYPEWKPHAPRREQHSLGQDDIPTTRERSPSGSVSARRERTERERERLKREDHDRGKDPRPGRIHSPKHFHRGSSSSTRHGPERRSSSPGHHRGSSSSTSHGPESRSSHSPGRSSRDSLKRPRDDSATRGDDSARRKPQPSAIKTKPESGSKSPIKTKPGFKSPIKTKAESGSKSPIKTKAESGSKSPIKTKAESGSKSPIKTKAESRSKSPIKTKPESGSKSPIKTKPESGSKSPIKTKPESGSKSPIKTKPESGSKSTIKTKAESGSKSTIKTNAESGSKSPIKTKPESGSKSPIKTKAESGSKSTIKTNAESGSKSPIKTKPESGSKFPIKTKAESGSKSTIKTKPEPGSRRTKPGSSEADETCTKGPPAKKVSSPSCQSTSAVPHLLHVTGVTTTVTQEEVADLVGGFGKINSVVLLSEEEEQKKLEAENSTVGSKGTSSQEKSAIGGEDSGNRPKCHKKSSEEEFSLNPRVLITRLPESYVIKLCQPFGATQFGKVEVEEERLKDFPDLLDFVTVDKAGYTTQGVKEAKAETSSTQRDERAMKAEENRGKDRGTQERERKEVEGREREAREGRKRRREDSPGSGATGSKRNSGRDGPGEAKAETSSPQGDRGVVKAQEHLPTGEEKESKTRREKDETERPEREVKEKEKIDGESKVKEGSPGSTAEGSEGNSKRDGPGTAGRPLEPDEAKEESPDDLPTVPTAEEEHSILKDCDSLESSGDEDAHLRGQRHAAKLLAVDSEQRWTQEKVISQQEAAGKEPSEQQLDMMQVGEELPNAAPTLVCNPQEGVETDKIKVSLAEKPEESKPIDTSSPEVLDKINSGPNKTKFSGSAAGNGEVSSCKPVDLKLNKVESEEHHTQDFPDLRDFVTVDEVGDDFPNSPPTDAVAMDTTVMVDKESPSNDSHTAPPADKKDSVNLENKQSAPGEQKKAVKMDNKNAEGDEYVEEIPNRNSKVILLNCTLCKCIFPKENNSTKEQHVKGQMHAVSLQLLVEKRKVDECFEEVHAPDGNVMFVRCKVCLCSIALKARDQHLSTEMHTRRLKLWLHVEAKKRLKEGNTDQKRSSKDGAAGKELSENAAPTQVCNPQEDVKTDTIKVSLAKKPEPGKAINTSPEGLDKINSGLKETKSSSNLPADKELPKESPGDDKDHPTVPTIDQEDSSPFENDKSVPGEEKKKTKGVGQQMDNKDAQVDDKIITLIRNPHGKVILLHCDLCKCSVKANAKYQHVNTDTHKRRLKLRLYFEAKKLKEDEVRDQTEEESRGQDKTAAEGLSEERKGDGQLDIKVESEDEEFDMTDFVTLDEVGDGDGCDLPGPPAPAAVSMDTSELEEEEEEKNTEEMAIEK